jgi:hypothetical protein
MGEVVIVNTEGGDATTTQPGEGAAAVEIIEGVIIATMPSAESQGSQSQ